VKRLACVILLVCGACQSDEKTKTAAVATARADEAYRTDIKNLCDSLALSGADKLEKGERLHPHATWLHANLKTQESKDFLVQIQPLVGEPKAKALDDEAKRVGLPGCALAAEWRAPQ
jgi:hypothetical protein